MENSALKDELSFMCQHCPLVERCQSLPKNEKPSCANVDRFEELLRMKRVELEDKKEKAQQALTIKCVITGIVLLCCLIAACMIGCPSYNVYVQTRAGEALLAHARSSREIAVTEAKAKMESAHLLASADTLRAGGVARSNVIIGQSLTESYLRWYWISELKPGGQVIYVPTEANLPLLEATRKP